MFSSEYELISYLVFWIKIITKNGYTPVKLQFHYRSLYEKGLKGVNITWTCLRDALLKCQMTVCRNYSDLD